MQDQSRNSPDNDAARRFTTDAPAFIDFGCGRGDSMTLSQTLFRGPGIGIDLQPQHVAECQKAGYDVQVADATTFNGRNLAPASISIDMMPELPDLQAFEAACTAMLRAARDFAVIQHLAFDGTETLLKRGLIVRGHADKSIRFRPRIMDYVHFVIKYGTRLDIVGLAVYGIGEPKVAPSPLPNLSGTAVSHDDGEPVFRSIRVLIARKEATRFRAGMSRAGSPNHQQLLLWEAG